MDLQAEARTKTWSRKQTHSPYNRGIAAGYGNIYMGTLDGKLVAIDAKTGKLNWETKLIDSEKLTVGFTGAPLLVKDKVIIGSQGGEWPYRGPIFGVNAKTGKKVWQFFTVGGNEGNGDARNTWGNDSWKTGGGGGWMAGGYDPETNTVWWGTGNPAPLYDWAGDKWKTEGPRPGDNLYTTSVLLLDPDTGKLKAYHQEMPHDAWDFDSAIGRVHDGRAAAARSTSCTRTRAASSSSTTAWQGAERLQGRRQHQLRQGHRPEDRRADRPARPGRRQAQEPVPVRSRAATAGTRVPTDPKTSLFYQVGYEWCIDLEVVKTEPMLEPMAQLNIGANFTFVAPEGDKLRGHIRARDPITGKVKFEIPYPSAPPHASLLTTGGNLLFVPEADGMLVAYDATNGKKLWTHNNGQGHNGGIISYMAKGKQYIAVMTGWGSLVGDGYGDLWGEPWVSMPKDSGVLKVFALQ